MVGLERQYGLLMRTYPASHRALYEDEIVATLLTTAADGQRYARLNEAAAIVKTGFACRFEDGSELKLGCQLAGIGALVAALTISTMAIALSVQMPLETGLVPAIAWMVVVLGALYAAWSVSNHRVTFVAVISLLILIGGASNMGLRRSLLVPTSMVLILCVCSRLAGHRLRLGAVLVGVTFGSVLGVLVTAEVGQVFPTESWVHEARWDIVSDALNLSSPLAFVVYFSAAIGFGFWRARYAVAASILAVPFAALTLNSATELLSSMFGARQLAVLSVIVVLGIVVYSLRFSWRETWDTQRHT